MQLRPAGVSDAVVDSAKALEALAALGGNRTYSSRRSIVVARLVSRAQTTEGNGCVHPRIGSRSEDTPGVLIHAARAEADVGWRINREGSGDDDDARLGDARVRVTVCARD